MKNSCVKLLMVAIMISTFGLHSCNKKEESKIINGTFVFKEVYDVVLHLKTGQKVSTKEMGTLGDMLATTEGQTLVDMMKTISYRFSGKSCNLMVDRAVSPAGTYTLSDNGRLVMSIPGFVMVMRYVENSDHMFIWDKETLKAMGGDPSAGLEEYGADNMEYWFRMTKQ